jgi:hypothetical protein
MAAVQILAQVVGEEQEQIIVVANMVNLAQYELFGLVKYVDFLFLGP